MAAVLKTRYFDYGFWKQAEAKPFATATHWVAVSRLMPYIDAVLTQLKQQFGEHDLLLIKHREIWKGDHDVDITNLSNSLPNSVQQQRETMVARVREQLDVLRSLAAALTHLPTAPQNQRKDEESGAKGDVSAINTGNVSNHIANFGTMSTGQKMDLAVKLTKQAVIDKDTNVQRQCLKQARPSDHNNCVEPHTHRT